MTSLDCPSRDGKVHNYVWTRYEHNRIKGVRSGKHIQQYKQQQQWDAKIGLFIFLITRVYKNEIVGLLMLYC